MINFLSLEFLFGIIIGCLTVIAIYQFTKKNNDNTSLETKITAIKTLLDEIKTSENQWISRKTTEFDFIGLL